MGTLRRQKRGATGGDAEFSERVNLTRPGLLDMILAMCKPQPDTDIIGFRSRKV